MGIGTSTLRVAATVCILRLLLPNVGVAVELVPLPITSVSVEATAFLSGSPIPEQSSGEMPSTASLTFVFSEADHAGTLTVSASVVTGGIEFSSSMLLAEVGPVSSAQTNALVTVRLDVPFVGGAVTPIIGRIEDLVASDTGEISNSGAFITQPNAGLVNSSAIGEVLANTLFSDEDRRGFVLNMVAGDTIELNLRPGAFMTGLGVGSAQSDRSFVIRLYTVGQAPGSGDLNADGLTDILDSTLLRRVLAGF